MLLAEMKRRLNTRYVLFSILGLLVITIGLNFLILKGSQEITEDLKEEAVYEGKLTEEDLLASLIKVRDEGSDEIRYQTQVSVINSMVNIYPGIEYSESKIQDYPNKFAENFYSSWKNKFETLIEMKLPEKDQEVALKKLNEVKIPFTIYPGYYYFFTILENIQIIFMFILLLVMFFASGTYADSFEDGSIEIIQATKGYKKSMFIKILPSIFYGITLTLIGTLITIGMVSSVIGTKALKNSFKMISLFSFGNFSIGQVILIMFVSEIIGVLSLSALMGYISLKTKETTKSIVFGIIFTILYLIGSRSVSPSANIIAMLFNLIPIASSQILKALSAFTFHLGIWQPYVVLLESLAIFIISAVALIFNINKKETNL